jgi:mono/diheme cytochrome c family protein
MDDRILLVFGLLATTSCMRYPQASSAVDDGRTWYVRACASCHGEGGRGDGPVAAALRNPPPDLTTLAVRRGNGFPRDYVIAVITGERELPAHGTREMPVWSQRFGAGGAPAVASLYARRRLEDLADHVAALQRPAQ